MLNNIWFTFSVGDTMRAVSNQVLCKTDRIGDTKYNTQCSLGDKP
jgi:hypothetical protein